MQRQREWSPEATIRISALTPALVERWGEGSTVVFLEERVDDDHAEWTLQVLTVDHAQAFSTAVVTDADDIPDNPGLLLRLEETLIADLEAEPSLDQPDPR